MNKSFHINPWVSFSIISSAAVLSLFSRSIFLIILFGFGVLMAYPNEKFQLWLNNKKLEALNALVKLFYFSVILLVIIGIFLFASKLVSRIASIGNYQGMSAKEWFYEYTASETDYQNLHDCVENSVSYYGFEDYENLQYQLDDVESCL